MQIHVHQWANAGFCANFTHKARPRRHRLFSIAAALVLPVPGPSHGRLVPLVLVHIPRCGRLGAVHPRKPPWDRR